jgi:hypothetical protein
MAYERTINFMGNPLFSVDFLQAQKKNPKESITTDVYRVEQTDDEIVDFVAKEMSGALGDVREPARS